MGLFASYSPGTGMKYQTMESKYGRTFGKERFEYLFVYYNLLENGFLAQNNTFFVTLTEKGFVFINSDEPIELNVSFEYVKILSKTKDEMFANLWHIIGQKDKCLCYVDGPTFFNSISSYLPILGSYSEYMKELHDKTGNNSRITWYKDLFYKLPEDSINSFLGKLSELYNQSVSASSTINFDIASLEETATNKSENKVEHDMGKKNKIFISHSGKDEVIVNSLVDLLGEIIHISKENLFCSSVSGFDVMIGKNFMDNIMEQYKNYNLFVLYVLSANYMGSPMCLNEMGASWMTKTDSVGILLPGFDISDLGNSCYDKRSISAIFNQGDKIIIHRLNQLKEIIENLFPQDTKNINLSRWEEKRDNFISTVKAAYEDKKKIALKRQN